MGLSTTYERAMLLKLRRHGVHSHQLKFKEHRLHVVDVEGTGSLPPLVLVHGFSGSAITQFAALMTRLSPHFRRIIVPDLPGHGLSSIPKGKLSEAVLQEGLAAVLTQLIDEPFSVFGSSLGGGLSMRYASQNPGRVNKLMLCSPAGAPMSDSELEALQGTFRIRGHHNALQFVDRLFPQGHSMRHFLALGVRYNFSKRQFRSLLESATEAKFFTKPELLRLTMPILFLWGQQERVLPTSNLNFFKTNLPAHTHFSYPPNFGHAPFVDQVDDLAMRLLAFAQDNKRSFSQAAPKLRGTFRDIAVPAHVY